MPLNNTEQEKNAIILVMGVTGVGKSTFIQHATGEKMNVVHGMESSTAPVGLFQIPGTTVYLCDTPGFDDTYNMDVTTLDAIDNCLGATFATDEWRIAGVIYVHDITQAKMKGSGMKNLRMFEKVVGKDQVSNCCLVTSKWSLQRHEDLEAHEAELKAKFWKPLLERGARMERFGDSMQSAIDIIRPLAENSFVPQLVNETQILGKTLVQTEAGKEVNDNLEDAKMAHKKELEELFIQQEEAIRDKDWEMKQIIATEKQENEERLAEIEKARKVLEDRQKRKRDDVTKFIRISVMGAKVAGVGIMTVFGHLVPAAVLGGSVAADFKKL
ncbi:P-loop containing nucleoside triphosphate hydrolase [Penicillium sp. IBT 18751x]|nr:P-loop containing nucleoside triphosphate hydrolase [Penicillium sp. IBT 18751x]